ncbi:MAG: hypothetical protein JNL66_06570 [Alphaproteobacteria bacterium]|nr:hypothetical protein [Alphaproteobacteria bacterium]
MLAKIPFVERLPHPDARAAFTAWHAARRRAGNQTPHLASFAPQDLPRSAMPLAFVYEVRPDRELLCVLAGEDLRFLFSYNPKGKTLREMVPGPLGEERANQVFEVLRTGLPFWMEGRVLIDGRTHVVMGRLVLPVQRGVPAADGVLILYSRLSEFDAPIAPPIEPVSFSADPVIWCTPADLA